MTEVKLTFTVPLGLSRQLQSFRCAVDHLLSLLGVTGWRWEFDDGAVKEIIRGPFPRATPEVFNVPLTGRSLPCASERIHNLRRQG